MNFAFKYFLGVFFNVYSEVKEVIRSTEKKNAVTMEDNGYGKSITQKSLKSCLCYFV